ncbi:antibiotic biosynthesis monooxygenase [Sulfitobacter sp. M57]|uniref:putative quinol monooxygenase n=1 Tax=unclassified Sulfitobacter TaxID=196795 RepID=UPI0023E2FD2E|nr:MULTISPECIES: antibiotic biosynthesis monooxygenase [unclassified Sulfitobacter]MDF3413677.1 antibiotic biosynthesis monooxygenase [Sulfitobacter sp. KE5]MDF3421042.1 antibiotic biosynthesis monooxygenase [Sulfitobacter sp. KE43]MDF3432223.1 antibiotic biosynthesis monooxygenase [Sulfitobacter sp. KE42]MDF3457862.1 antibiotic biosynthesis monooxygenase [Sulfitobacter sp. S74]MDF3461763.1 antibiotic biosynthesis monooxygenase [Sulfitobacter sp. Ks18]
MGVTLKGYLRCADEAEAGRVRAALDEHIRLTRAEAGCVSFHVTATDDPLVWQVAEEFTTPVAFEAHQTRAAASDWARETRGIAREYEIKGMS